MSDKAPAGDRTRHGAPPRFGEPLDALRGVYGYEAFRGDQGEVISEVIAGRDAVVLMPTGGGKSLCYNIQYRIEPKARARDQLLEFITSQPQGTAGIVYALTRKSVEETAEFLSKRGIDAVPYHAGMDPSERAASQARFLRKDVLRRASTKARAPETLAPATLDPADEDLFQKLRAWRTETAREQGVPTYVVFPDATPKALARARPAALEELDGVRGIGQKKRDAYGPALLSLIAEP